jgi:putative peptidoglycan lipid II flippase
VIEDLPGSPGEEAARPGASISLASVGRSAAILTGATAAVQLLGIVRELFLAAQVGISTDLDALLVGLVLPATLSSVLTAGVSTALVPAYVEARTTRGSADARRLAGTVLAWVALAGLAVTVLLEIFAPGTVALTGPGLSPPDREQAVGYLRLLAPTTAVAGVTGILFAVCQAEQQFKSIGWSILVGPASTLVIMLALWGRLGLGAFAVGTLVGPFLSLLVLLVATIRRKVAPRPHLVSRDMGLGAFARHAFPLTVSSAILQLNVIFDRAVASLIAPGAVSALRYGDTLVRVPTGAISPAWGAAIYPAFVRANQDTQRSGLSSAAEQALRYVLVVFVPLSALTLAVAPVAVSAAYGRGAFTPADLQQTALVVAAFAPLVCTMMISQSLTGALNARRSGTVLLAAGTINVILNCTLDVVLGFPLGIAGVALSSSLTAVIVSIYKARQLARREPGFRLRPLAAYLGRASLASLPGALVLGALSWAGIFPTGLVPGLATLAVFGVVGILVYVVLATRIGLDEPMVLVKEAQGWMSRRRRPAGPAA